MAIACQLLQINMKNNPEDEKRIGEVPTHYSHACK